MKFTCDQASLSKALSVVSRAVSQRTTIPVLKSVLLEVKDGGFLKLSASDLDFSIERTIDVEVFEEGAIAVNAKLFQDIIRKLPNGQVLIEVDENNTVSIKCLQSNFNIVGTSAAEFPSISDIEEPEDTLSFDKDIFTNMVNKTSFCASIDESRGVIVGVLLELEKESFNMVAVDGYRLAITREPMKSASEKKIIINAKILNEVNKILMESGVEEDIQLILGDKKAVMLLHRTKIGMRLLEGDFLKYKDILPKEKKVSVEVNRKELLNAVERASLLAREGRNNLITLSLREDFIEITSRSEEGNVNEVVSTHTTGQPLDIGFNSKYVMDVLKVVDEEDILMEFNTGITPCLVKPLEGDRFVYMILPVRIASR